METNHLIRRDFLKAATPVLFGAGATTFVSCSSQQQQLENNKAIIVREVEDFYNAKKYLSPMRYIHLTWSHTRRMHRMAT